MKVFLTGGTGFVGSYVLRALRRDDHTVRCLTRHPAPGLKRVGIEVAQGDVTDPSSLKGAMEDADAVVHLVGIIEEHAAKGITFEALHHEATQNVVEAAKSAGVNHFIFMSANGAKPESPSRYETTKWKAEQVVKGAGFERWTIFRPSTIFGDPGLHTVNFEETIARKLVKPFPIIPVFGDGLYRLQPVSVEEVADGFAQALAMEAANHQIYHVGGPQTYTFNRVCDIIAEALQVKRRPKFHVPLWLGRPFVEVFGRIGLLPITPAQLHMLVEGNTCDPTPFYRDFEVQPAAFSAENIEYLRARV